jgi:hypothetical protein
VRLFGGIAARLARLRAYCCQQHTDQSKCSQCRPATQSLHCDDKFIGILRASLAVIDCSARSGLFGLRRVRDRQARQPCLLNVITPALEDKNDIVRYEASAAVLRLSSTKSSEDALNGQPASENEGNK